MKIFKITALLVFFVCSFLLCASILKAQDQGSTPPPATQPQTQTPPATEPAKPQEQIQQKITTPPMQLSQEEEKRVNPPQAGAVGQTPGQPGQQNVEFAPKMVKTKTRLELILDASGSMNGQMDQTTKMAILKSAVKDVITEPLPEGATREIGVRVYGNTKGTDANDCKDTTLLVPVGQPDEKDLTTKLDSINAMGVTPLGFALEEAAKDFQADPNYDNVIILIADGADSCAANICDIAKKIHDSDKKIMVNVIGFDLDQKTAESFACVGTLADGQIALVRNESELRASLDKILMANVPYNLRIQVFSGATPLPSSMTVYRAGTKTKVKDDKTSGIKFYQLPPGTYDIEITYTDSKETPLPSKLIRGVEVQTTSKAEQIVQFDLGMLTLTSYDQNGQPVMALYEIKKKDSPNVSAKAESAPGPYNLWLTEGVYNVSVTSTTPEGLTLTATAGDLQINKGGSITHDFQFQVGKINLVGKNSKGVAIPLVYKVTLASDDAKTIVSGDASVDGKTIELPPGKYNLYYHMLVPDMVNLPDTKIEAIEIAGGDSVEKAVEIDTATVILVAKDDKDKFIQTSFVIKPTGSDETGITLPFTDKPVSQILPVGKYDIKAEFTVADFTPPPSLIWNNIELTKDQIFDKVAVFKYGILTISATNVSKVPINTAFNIFKSGTDELVATLTGIEKPTDIKLTEGVYDIKAEDLTSRSDQKPYKWQHNVIVTSGKPNSQVIEFDQGKLKILCVGENRANLTCDYKVYTYGTDRPLYAGTTKENWIEFDMPVGSYYIEAGYHDVKDEVLLKKWITIGVAPNQIVEQEMRF